MQKTRQATAGHGVNVSGGKREANRKKKAAPQKAVELQKRT